MSIAPPAEETRPPNAEPERDPADAAARDAMDRSLVHGVAWTGGLKWAAQVASWASTLIVVRLLAPEDYGIMGMATMYLGLIHLLSEFGVGAAVLALRDLGRSQVAQLNTLSVLFGIAGFAASCAAAVPLARFFDAPDLPPVVIVVGLGFIISAFRVVPYSLLAKEMEFKVLSLYGVAQALASSAITIALAAAGFGYWALALGGLLSGALYMGLIVRRRPYPFRWPRTSSIGAAMTFSSHIIVGRLAWYTYSNADFLVIGRVLGQASLGVYTVAWSLSTMVVDKVSAVVGQVVPAYFSATQKDHAALRRYLLSITEVLAIVTFPAAIGLALVARDFAVVVLGDQWVEAVVPLQLLAAYGVIRSVTPMLPQVLSVIGDSAFPAKVGVAAAVILPIGFYVGADWGITGVASVWLAGYPLVLIPLYLRLFRKISLSPAAYMRSLWPASSGSAAMVAAVVALQQLPPFSDPSLLGLMAQVGTGGVAYAVTLVLLHRERLRTFRVVIARARGASPAPVAELEHAN